MKILVISAYRGIGDLIFHLPLFKYLNKKFKTKINLITVHNTKAKYILKKEKIISKIVYGDFNRQQILKKIFNLTSEINKFKSDLAVLTASSKRLRASLIISNAKKKIRIFANFCKSYGTLKKNRHFRRILRLKYVFLYKVL